MNDLKIREIVESLINTFFNAGEISLNLRKKGLTKNIKEDNTPVSNGDLEVNKIITKDIMKLTPEVPIISEETSHNKSIKNLKNFWLVDPIDGTYGYINNLDEFTINAGLIVDSKAAAGIIYAPAKKRMFYSFNKQSSFELTNGKLKKLDCKKKTKKNTIKVVSYSNNLKPEIKKIHNEIGVTEYVKMSSSLKFCVIAAGEYDGYVAEPRACEWDIAAGHAILENAGGLVSDFEGNKVFYGKENFKNPSLILKRCNNLNE